MSLEDYKKAVEMHFRKMHPKFTGEEVEAYLKAPEELWQERYKDFSPQITATMLTSGLI